MASYIINKNNSLIINVNEIVNNNATGYWSVVGDDIKHVSSLASYIDKQYPFLITGNAYRITYIANHTSCDFRIHLGDTQGLTHNVSGTYTQILTFTGTNKRVRFWSNGEVIINSILIEELQNIVVDNLLPLDNDSIIQNKGFTLSYYPELKQWVSFHSYLPNNYIIHPNSLLTKENSSQVKQVNKGDYGKYFDTDIKSFIIESIFNESPITTKVFDNIVFNLKSTSNNIQDNKFFDNIVLSTEYQISGSIELNLTNLTKKERNWCINKFTDLTNNTNNTLFSSNWEDIKNNYPIDKVVNSDKIDSLKPWYQRARFRDKFLKVRFTENNLQNSKLICNFVSSTFRVSQR